MSESEVDRIQRVYTGYRDPSVRARWSQDNPGNRSIARERDRRVAQRARQRAGGEVTGADAPLFDQLLGAALEGHTISLGGDHGGHRRA